MITPEVADPQQSGESTPAVPTALEDTGPVERPITDPAVIDQSVTHPVGTDPGSGSSPPLQGSPPLPGSLGALVTWAQTLGARRLAQQGQGGEAEARVIVANLLARVEGRRRRELPD